MSRCFAGPVKRAGHHLREQVVQDQPQAKLRTWPLAGFCITLGGCLLCLHEVKGLESTYHLSSWPSRWATGHTETGLILPFPPATSASLAQSPGIHGSTLFSRWEAIADPAGKKKTHIISKISLIYEDKVSLGCFGFLTVQPHTSLLSRKPHWVQGGIPPRIAIFTTR